MKKREIYYLIFMACCIILAAYYIALMADLNCYVKNKIKELDEIFIKQEGESKKLQKEELNCYSVLYNISTITVLRKIRAIIINRQIQLKNIFVCRKEMNFISYKSELFNCPWRYS